MSDRPDPGARDEVGRWARRRAPELLARAEAEAVAALRDALVAAALDDAAPAPSPATSSASEQVVADTPEVAQPVAGPAAEDGLQVHDTATPDDQCELLWAYCVLREGEPVPAGTVGVAAPAIERVIAGDLAALVSRVPAAEFGAEPLTRNLNDLVWLERVARAHEAVLDIALAQGTIVPLRMCTIFESDDGVREMLERRRESLTDALRGLDGRLEWAVKVLVDRDRLADAARAQGGAPAEPSEAGEGGAYLQRRRTERGVREAASRLATDTAQQVHARLQDWALDARTRPPQNPDLSGHTGEMVLNAAYLVQRERTDELHQIVTELEAHHRGLGARIELTGPWPPYNFIAGEDSAALA